MTEIINPYQEFLGLDGNPIESGTVYIGTYNTNPKILSNQIACYFDSALTLAAGQPLNISGGYIVRAGSPTRIYTQSTAYSISVYDKKDNLVYTENIDTFNINNPVNISSFANLASTSATLNQIVNLVGHTVSGIGGGQFIAKSGSVTNDGGTQINSATGGLYWQRINFTKFNSSFFNIAQTNTAGQNDAAIANALTAIAANGGGTLFFEKGTYLISQTISSSVSSIVIELDDNCTIDYSAVASYIAVNLTGAGSKVIGGLNGGFLGPASWDGANVSPTYASIMMQGDRSYVSTRLVNVRKVGVWFKDVADGTAENCYIFANYPAASWTGVETVNYAILFDPNISASRGNFKALGNTIKQSVQGIMAANYGSGQIIQGLVIDGNIFEDCWNHGIYSNYTAGAVITGNSFNRCQVPVVVSGPKNNVSGNTIYTDVTSVGDQRDIVGISARDAVGTIISNNTIIGTSIPTYAVVIDVRNFDGTTAISDNIIENNTITITSGLSVAIRILSNTTPIRNNRIGGNTIRVFGVATSGAIEIDGNLASLSASYGNIVIGNAVTLLAESHGIYTTYLTGSTINSNTVSYEFNAGAAINVSTVQLFNCISCVSDLNASVCTAAYGTNINITGFIELSGSATNRVSNSRNSVVAPATYNTFQALANSKLDVNDSGPGAPGQTAATGSIWRRTDGAAGSTLYIKETINTSAVWRAV